MHSQRSESGNIEIPPPLFNVDMDGTIMGVLQENAFENVVGTQNSLNDSLHDFLVLENPRFATITESELRNLEKASKADSTHKNTRWAAKLFMKKKIFIVGNISYNNYCYFFYFFRMPYVEWTGVGF